jgi:hypothetical protein
MSSRELPALPFLNLEAQRKRRDQGLVVIVNLQNDLKCAESEPDNSELSLKVLARRRRVIELRKLGHKIPSIQQIIAEETSIFWSEGTIKRDLQSITAEEELEELKRQQDADIALEGDRKVRLEYRDRAIERLMPRKGPEVAVHIENQVQANVCEKIDLTKLSIEERAALLRAEEALTRTETAVSPK